MAGETTAVWWPPPPSPYPLLLRIGKKPAPVDSGGKFPFSTQPNRVRTLSSPSPTQQLCVWHRAGHGGIDRDLRGEDHLEGSWGPSPGMEDLLASPQLMVTPAEDSAAGYSLPAHTAPELWHLPGILHRKNWRLEREQRLLSLSGRGEERAEW